MEEVKEKKEKKMVFLAHHSARLVELVLERKNELVDNNRTRAADAARKRTEKWEEAVNILNSEFPDFKCDAASAKAHMIYRKSITKEKNALANKMKKGTRGGPNYMVPTLTDAESKIVDEMGDTAAFAGIPSGGVESPIGGTSPAAAHPITGTALAKSIETVRAVAAFETPSATSSVDGETEQQLEDGAPPLKTRKLSLKHAASTSSSTDHVRSLQIQVLEAQKRKLAKPATCSCLSPPNLVT